MPKDGEARVDKTVPMIFSADETCDVGKEGGSPVSPDYGPSGNAFSGKINWVQIDVGVDECAMHADFDPWCSGS